MRPATLPADRLVLAPSERRALVLKTIRRARRDLVLSIFRCTDEEIIAEIGRAVDRGVHVDILVTSRSKGRQKLRRLWNVLQLTGATVHAHSDPVVKYHAKYLVADDGPAIVASLNFTRKCFESTVDALAVTYDPAVVDGLRSLQAADREGASLPDGLPDRLIIGPERARRQLRALIDAARSSIRLIDAKLSDPAMTSLLESKQRQGVAVDVYSQKKLADLRSHGKLMLIDDSIAVIGSLALASLSLDFRREVALVVRDPRAARMMARLFDSVAGAETRARSAHATGGASPC